jgi:Xaa-Pro aminopeptidase
LNPDRIEKLRKRMWENDLDAVLIQSAYNRRYLSGFTGSAGLLIITSKKALLFVDFRYTAQAQKETAFCEVIESANHKEELTNLLNHHTDIEKIGFEADHVTYNQYYQLNQDFPCHHWVPIQHWIEELRGYKDNNELELMRQAIHIGDLAFDHLCRFIKEGMTEKQIALELEWFMRKQGGEGLAFPSIVASGPNGALPHVQPSDRRLQKGDLVVLDYGCIIGGYCSDLTRTVAVGYKSKQAEELYNLVLTAQEEAIKFIAPGVLGQQVDKKARDIISQAGYGECFGHSLGHGIGLEVHEEVPRLSQKWEKELTLGMVSSVEPGVYLPDWGGIRIEDLVWVTSNGCEVLSKASKEFLVVG